MNEIITTVDEHDRVSFQEFDSITISDYDFSKIEFETITFKSCKFIECIFNHCYFNKCTFIDCDISNGKFNQTFIKESIFKGTKAIGTDFQESVIKKTIVDNGIFRYANFTMNKWDGVTIKDCDLLESSISNTKLSKVKIERTILTSTDIFKSSMKNIDLSTCEIDGITISNDFEELKGAKINMHQASKLIATLGIKVVE